MSLMFKSLNFLMDEKKHLFNLIMDFHLHPVLLLGKSLGKSTTSLSLLGIPWESDIRSTGSIARSWTAETTWICRFSRWTGAALICFSKWLG